MNKSTYLFVLLSLFSLSVLAQSNDGSAIDKSSSSSKSNYNGNDSFFLVLPNPSDGNIDIKGVSKTTLVEVLDRTGEVVLSETGNSALDLTSMPDGPYFIRKAVDDGFAMARVILIK
ncbi:MAG: hypothetical protein HRT72_00030 [Flavobacteriales bacterium]|nr:hypothetical protein [Flavobacteriales bacterium]